MSATKISPPPCVCAAIVSGDREGLRSLQILLGETEVDALIESALAAWWGERGLPVWDQRSSCWRTWVVNSMFSHADKVAVSR
jgi:hypothetical protein